MRLYAGMFYTLYMVYVGIFLTFPFIMYINGEGVGWLNILGFVITSLHITFFHVLSLLCHVDRKRSKPPPGGICIYPYEVIYIYGNIFIPMRVPSAYGSI